MKKKITIVVECETNKENPYLLDVLPRRVYRALDSEPHYIASPKNVHSINIKIDNID